MRPAEGWDDDEVTDRFPVVSPEDETEDSRPEPVARVATWWSQAALMARAALG